ncbi:hypothetical protein [Paludisphaera mucosa]|uniref:Uncharacterized protein n=1 Tax=Paludisphaera mucosa TaxID=3030827 RepID=A0ABT6FK48_9BACT|nr:hypothetical protein [Paludisphaera mucosa]MDG3007925.1 hypothetical protein [Paludisphaera mucosa]
MNRRRPTPAAWACACLLLAAAPPAPAQQAGPAPDVAAIAAAGRATAARMQKEACIWKATTYLQGGVEVLVEVLATPARRRTTLSMAAQGRRSEMIRIIERDGVWYAAEGKKAGKYRPYEAPFELGTAYHFLTLSQPHVIPDAEDVGLDVYEGTKDGIATYRTPLAEHQKQQARQMLAAFDQVEKQTPKALTPEVRRTIDEIRAALERGVAVKVDLAAGMLVQFGAADKRTEIREFRWIDREDPEAFRVEGKSWEDFTSDPTEGDRAELAVLGHAGTWRPGMKGSDTDGRLLDLSTGRFRRIPFEGSTSIPGCFLKGRTRVAVSSVDPFEGTVGLYEIDLKSGANRRLGGELLAIGITMQPALSPDGETLVALHRGPTERVLDQQAVLVDVASGESRPLGRARDQAFFSWLPEGRGFVFLSRESADPDDLQSARTPWICRMDMEGKVERIRQGNFPVLLDGRTILFRDDAAKAWRTCGLDGGDPKPYAGGLPDYNFPSLGPDGKRLLMMRFRQGAAPEPTILPLGSDAGKPAVSAPGLWASPAWR